VTNYVNWANNDENGPGLYDWIIIKNMPNGTKKRYSTMAYTNNTPYNSETIGFSEHMASPRTKTAIKIQRLWRNKKAKGPFKNPEMQNILVRQIMSKLPIKNRPSLAAAFRPPTRLNKEITEQRKRTNKYWKALLNNMTQKAIMRGSIQKLTGEEIKKLHNQGKIHFNFNRQPYRTFIPNNKRATAAATVREMRRR
jgi:LytS/YehU family sensor histidine kinase